ncbi:DUF2865 domain-containing protein [Mesorhizobium sp. LHD-90]|uniref:DUF2865 domain-containing protein n=1 Tax=Mesorhizobium sp. LHD-90 TaxID=3071414 RepID=UPI0027DF829F|nr:DUF2865 domain-containing protein [Mesorhizobium sp. LHD-90]MDQ6434811.1 DUF2865 domain-containing protein [Mesorhizobium sp. LHD-90]
MDSIRAVLVRLAALALVGLLFASSAHAQSCADLLRMASRGGGASSPEAAALTRQLIALQALERKRQCSSRARGGFFNPCAELQVKKADVQRRLSRAKGGGAAALRARAAAMGCVVERRKATSVAGRSGPSGPYVGSNAMLYCVRVADGYFFPVPGAQFLDSGDYKDTVDQCRYICKGSETAVYRLDDGGLETEEMVSVETGKPYKELPTAFAYRDSANFEGCDFPSYYRRVEEARARTVTPRNMENALIPLPKQRPEDMPPLMALTEEKAPAPALAKMPTDRPVRVVGPNFFPEE